MQNSSSILPRSPGAGQGPRNRRGIARFRWLALLPVGLALLTAIAIAFRIGMVFQNYPRPQAIFVLGGNLERYIHALRLAAERPDLPIVISSGITEGGRVRYARRAGVDPNRITVDSQAVDTLTNFTRMADSLRRQGYRHVYLLTSDYHMRRGCAVAGIVFAVRGIAFTPVPTPSQLPAEPWGRVWRDVLRSLVWLFSGWDGQPRLPDLSG